MLEFNWQWTQSSKTNYLEIIQENILIWEIFVTFTVYAFTAHLMIIMSNHPILRQNDLKAESRNKYSLEKMI